MANQVIQDSIERMRSVTRLALCVLDLDGKKVASVFEPEGLDAEVLDAFVKSPAESQTLRDFHLFKVCEDEQPGYVLVTRGADEEAYMLGKLEAGQLEAILRIQRERFDRNGFMQDLLLDNLLAADIYNRSRQLHIQQEAERAVFLIETKHREDVIALETVRSLFGNTRDFVTAVDEKRMVLIKEFSDRETYENLEQVARTLVDMLNAEAMTQVRVAYGSLVQDLKNVSRSYKEARFALDVGRIFYESRTVTAYENLGIGRLIYQLPPTLCESFLKEVFGEEMPELDEETLNTIRRFFDNNLNVSETARQMFLHRNTLVYRLEKLEKLTGLDVRSFEDAMTLQIALMVGNYRKYLGEQER